MAQLPCQDICKMIHANKCIQIKTKYILVRYNNRSLSDLSLQSKTVCTLPVMSHCNNRLYQVALEQEWAKDKQGIGTASVTGDVVVC